MTAPTLLPREKPRFQDQCRRIQRLYLGNPGAWFSLPEIVRAIGASSEAGVSARLREISSKHGWTKERRIRAGNLREYRLSPPNAPVQIELLP